MKIKEEREKKEREEKERRERIRLDREMREKRMKEQIEKKLKEEILRKKEKELELERQRELELQMQLQQLSIEKDNQNIKSKDKDQDKGRVAWKIGERERVFDRNKDKVQSKDITDKKYSVFNESLAKQTEVDKLKVGQDINTHHASKNSAGTGLSNDSSSENSSSQMKQQQQDEDQTQAQILEMERMLRQKEQELLERTREAERLRQQGDNKKEYGNAQKLTQQVDIRQSQYLSDKQKEGLKSPIHQDIKALDIKQTKDQNKGFLPNSDRAKKDNQQTSYKDQDLSRHQQTQSKQISKQTGQNPTSQYANVPKSSQHTSGNVRDKEIDKDRRKDKDKDKQGQISHQPTNQSSKTTNPNNDTDVNSSYSKSKQQKTQDAKEKKGYSDDEDQRAGSPHFDLTNLDVQTGYGNAYQNEKNKRAERDRDKDRIKETENQKEKDRQKGQKRYQQNESSNAQTPSRLKDGSYVQPSNSSGNLKSEQNPHPSPSPSNDGNAGQSAHNALINKRLGIQSTPSGLQPITSLSEQERDREIQKERWTATRNKQPELDREKSREKDRNEIYGRGSNQSSSPSSAQQSSHYPYTHGSNQSSGQTPIPPQSSSGTPTRNPQSSYQSNTNSSSQHPNSGQSSYQKDRDYLSLSTKETKKPTLDEQFVMVSAPSASSATGSSRKPAQPGPQAPPSTSWGAQNIHTKKKS
ncbi:MAG: hypothetical protein EZS28_028769 [Streblomastix strix]|uniref:Uncharacterized protein n=1 Tax=Streblomastix strix TaxID=222440 RepID=A0A5J4UZQ7_9EUKA|nr:MAG: hypothetical protein EZS28_028769 [Streblomastix strix]